VGAGLTDDEVYTYYELVDELQTELGRGVTDPNAFITTWDTRITGTGTITGTSSIALPLYGTQAITASWGDGTTSLISQSTQVDVTHSYATPGVYTVSITGQGQGFQFNNGGDRAKLMDIGQWGSISGSVGAVFFGCTNLVGTAADIHPVAGLTSYFRGTVKFNGAIGNWNTSDITDMLYTFGDATAFNQPIGSWNVGNVTRMTNTFLYASSFNQNIGNWDVSKVTEMARMFDQSPFNNGGSPDINNWRPISCSDFTSMFANCPFNQPIGNWPLSASNITSMRNMFNGAIAFNQNIGSWDVSKVTGTTSTTGFYRMFLGATNFNNSGSADINNWRFTTSSTVTMANMFDNADAFNQNIGAWNVEKVTNMSGMFVNTALFNNSGSSDINNWRPISCSNFNGTFAITNNFNQPIGNWPLSASNINMTTMFYLAAAFNQPLGTWNTSNVTLMTDMFNRATAFNQNIGSWNVEKVTNMSGMFQSAGAFNNSGSSDINNWRPISCSNFSSMFRSATAFNQPIGNWTIGTGSQIPVTGISMASMFNDADAFNQNIGAWNVEKVTSMASMFASNRDFNNSGSSDINNWRPISCSNFGGMFSRAIAFNQPIGSWPLSASSINMDSMFFSTTNFNQPIGSWNVSKVTNMSEMFSFAGPFNQPIGSWDVSNVTNMNNMFYAAGAFNQDIGNWNVSKVTTFNFFMYVGGYSYLHTIYDGWIQNRLQPQRFWRAAAKYSGSAAEGRALLSRPYVTQSIVNIQDSSSFINIVTQDAHNLTPNNKVFILQCIRIHIRINKRT
jgi:surface protein